MQCITTLAYLGCRGSKPHPHVKSWELEQDRGEVKPFWSVHSAAEEVIHWEPAAGLSRSDSVSWSRIERPMVLVFLVNKLRQHNTVRVQHPQKSQLSQAGCRLLCQEEYVSLHRAQHRFWWSPLLQDPGVCSSECLSLEHEEAKSLSRNSSAVCKHSGAGGAAGQGGGRQSDLCFPLPPLHFCMGVCPAIPVVSAGGIHRPGQVQDEAGGVQRYPLNFSAVPRWNGALTHQFEMWLGWSLPASDCKLLISMAVSIASSAIKKKNIYKHLFSSLKKYV